MRLLFWMLTLCFLQTTQAFGYVEETNADEAEMSAGDQNTNLFRMQAKGEGYIKKFKEINKLIEQQDAGGSYTDAADIDMLIRNSQRDRQEKELDNILASVEKRVENAKDLRVVSSHEVYEAISALSRTQVYDTDAAAAVLAEIQRIRR